MEKRFSVNIQSQAAEAGERRTYAAEFALGGPSCTLLPHIEEPEIHAKTQVSSRDIHSAILTSLTTNAEQGYTLASISFHDQLRHPRNLLLLN